MDGERERLCAKLRSSSMSAWHGYMNRAADLLEADAAELAKLRKDAERYRWLRNSSVNQYTHPICVTQERVQTGDGRDYMRYVGPLMGGDLDLMIEAALASPQNEAKDKGEG